MQKVGLFIFLFFLFPHSLFALEPCQEKNFIFLIHGVAGSEDTFGHLAPYLKNVDRCYEVFSFEYDTGSSKYNVNDFAQRFYHYSLESFKSKGGMPQDKISLIMHSQGGLIGSMWIKKLISEGHSFTQQIDSFISLSTPFWGAPIASVGQRIFYSGIDNNPISPFGKKELNEMSFGSHTIHEIYEDFHDLFSLTGIRPLALGGLKRFSNLVVGEDDLVVPVYSSRPDHFRAALNHSIARGPASIKSSHFERTNYFKFIPIKADHFNLDLPGIASVPFKCLLFLECSHPAVRHIVRHLKGEESEESRSSFHQFRVQIFLDNETRDISSFKDARLSVLKRDGTWIPRYQALTRYRGKASNKEGKAFTFFGVTLRQGQRMIKVKINLKNKFQKVLEIPVEGGHTSIIHLRMND